MTRFSSLSADDQARLEDAARWRLRLAADHNAATHGEFGRWLEADGNRRAFEAVMSAMSDVQDAAGAPEMLALRQAALHRARRHAAWRWLPRTTVRAAAVLLAVILAGAAGGTAWFLNARGEAYATQRGERREIALADGSHVLLDSDSRVWVRLTERARLLTLDRGRARFDVAHDPSRPFSVAAGDQSVVAIGTAFDVERLGARVVVTVLRGHVMVEDTAQARSRSAAVPISLVAGQELAAGAANPSVAPADLPASTAWETGRLVFDNAPLSTAVERVNRYTAAPIVVDGSVASTRISGMFNAGDSQAFVSSITSYFPVRASVLPDGRTVLTSSSPPMR